MEGFMEDSEAVKEQIQKDIVDKIKEYIEDKIDELSDISL
jgi:hypothetical protein